MRDNWKAGLQQVGRHGSAHDAEPNESDAQACGRRRFGEPLPFGSLHLSKSDTLPLLTALPRDSLQWTRAQALPARRQLSGEAAADCRLAFLICRDEVAFDHALAV